KRPRGRPPMCSRFLVGVNGVGGATSPNRVVNRLLRIRSRPCGPVVIRQRRYVRLEIVFMDCLDCLRGLEMEMLPARQAQLFIKRLTHQRVGKGVARPATVLSLDHEAMAECLFNCGHHHLLRKLAHASEYFELELASED